MAEQGTASTSQSSRDDTKSFTQAELDQLIEGRLAQERRKFSDYDDLAAKAARFDEIEDRNKSDLERLQGEIRARDEQLASLPSQVQHNVVRFASLANQAGFLDPEDALLNLADLDLGDAEAVQAALDGLAERKPHLIRADHQSSSADGLPRKPKLNDGTPMTGAAVDPKELAVAALRQMRRTQ